MANRNNCDNKKTLNMSYYLSLINLILFTNTNKIIKTFIIINLAEKPTKNFRSGVTSEKFDRNPEEKYY